MKVYFAVIGTLIVLLLAGIFKVVFNDRADRLAVIAQTQTEQRLQAEESFQAWRRGQLNGIVNDNLDQARILADALVDGRITQAVHDRLLNEYIKAKDDAEMQLKAQVPDPKWTLPPTPYLDEEKKLGLMSSEN